MEIREERSATAHGDAPREPTPVSGPGTRRAAARRWATGWTTGAPHSVGVALLVVTELVRADVGAMGTTGKGGQVSGGTGAAPEYVRGFAQLHESLSGHGWYRFAELLRDHLIPGDPRVLLWASVFAALVVRLNRYGPQRVQLVLSTGAAAYCVLAAVAGIPYLALAGGYALPFLLTLGTVVVVTSTWCGERTG